MKKVRVMKAKKEKCFKDIIGRDCLCKKCIVEIAQAEEFWAER